MTQGHEFDRFFSIAYRKLSEFADSEQLTDRLTETIIENVIYRFCERLIEHGGLAGSWQDAIESLFLREMKAVDEMRTYLSSLDMSRGPKVCEATLDQLAQHAMIQCSDGETLRWGSDCIVLLEHLVVAVANAFRRLACGPLRGGPSQAESSKLAAMIVSGTIDIPYRFGTPFALNGDTLAKLFQDHWYSH